MSCPLQSAKRGWIYPTEFNEKGNDRSRWHIVLAPEFLRNSSGFDATSDGQTAPFGEADFFPRFGFLTCILLLLYPDSLGIFELITGFISCVNKLCRSYRFVYHGDVNNSQPTVLHDGPAFVFAHLCRSLYFIDPLPLNLMPPPPARSSSHPPLPPPSRPSSGLFLSPRL